MRKGFSLIELILSIVIVGITVIAIPTVISQTLSNNTQGLIQQSVMDAKTRMALILKAPYSCVGNFSFKGPTPIFGNAMGNATNNFYTKNAISEDGRRVFALQDPKGDIKTVNFDESCNGLDKSINSFNTAKGSSSLKTTTSVTYGDRDNIIESVITTDTGYYNMQGKYDNNKGVTRVQVTSKTSLGKDTKTITLSAFAANIGDSPEILSGSW